MDPMPLSQGGGREKVPLANPPERGRIKLLVCLELEGSCYTISAVRGSGEEGMRASISLVLCLLLSVQILFCLRNDLFCLLTRVMHRQPV